MIVVLDVFITEDPAKDGSNWYAYCGNNPVMMFDPSGLDYYIFMEKIEQMHRNQLKNN